MNYIYIFFEKRSYITLHFSLKSLVRIELVCGFGEIVLYLILRGK